MDVTGVTGTYDTSYMSDAIDSTLGKEDFLNLLVTQLRYQNPLDPMDNTEFVAQLAQFSSLEQMTNLNTAFTDQSTLIQSMNNSMAASLVGREVVVASDRLEIPDGGTGKVGVLLERQAANVSIEITNEGGQVVRTLHRENVSAGSNTFVWDGRDANGRPVDGGVFNITVEASDVDGTKVTAFPLVSGVVESVVYEQGAAFLTIAGIQVPVGTLLEVLGLGTSSPNPVVSPGDSSDAADGDDGGDDGTAGGSRDVGEDSENVG